MKGIAVVGGCADVLAKFNLPATITTLAPDDLYLYKPKFVLILGSDALAHFDPNGKLSRDHGRMFVERCRPTNPPNPHTRRIYYPTFDPEVARLPKFRKMLSFDLARFAAMVKAKNPFEFMPKTCTCGEEGFGEVVEFRVKCIDHGD